MKKKTTFIWTECCQHAFLELRNNLLSPRILKYPDFNKSFILTTDASNIACGAVLSQDYNGQELPIAFASKAFNKAETKKPTIMQEMIAIHWAIDHFKPYLYGRKFIVKTDHRPLVYLFGMKEPTKKLTQMRLDLEDYDFEIHHIKGKDNVGADALSRIVTSEDLKNKTILMVHTRAMTSKQPESKNINVSSEKKIDHLLVYETDTPSKVRNWPKISIEIQNKMIITKIMNPKMGKALIIIETDFIHDNESQTLASALLEMNKLIKNKQIALSTKNEIFKHVSIQKFKEIANATIRNFQLVLYHPPKELTNSGEIEKILHDFHMTPTGGHIGQHRLYKKIRDLYYWKGMRNSIIKFVKACKLCKMNKVTKRTKEASIVTTTPIKPFDIVSIDTVGPLPKTAKNNRYCITMQCDLTKYVIIIPTENKEAETIARALAQNFILTYGKMLELRSDQGTEFNNEVLKQIGKILQFKQTFSTAYHPQSIGALERNHRCLNEYLRAFSNVHHNDWDEWTKFYEFVYNTTVHTDTEFTPYELVFGRKANLPQNMLGNKVEPLYNLEQYYSELKYKLQKSNEIARQHLIDQKIKRTSELNQKINPINVTIGDLVYITNENRKKLEPHYIGPFRITEIDNTNCTIQNITSNKQSKIHKNRIIKI